MTRRREQSAATSSLDEVAAERLLRGQRPSVGASSDEQALAKLLAVASAPPSVQELSGEARAVAAFTATRPAAIGPRHARHVARRHRLVLSPRVSHGVAAAAALGALTVGGVTAAAYSGSLPDSMQRLAHDHIGAPRHHPPRTHANPAPTHLTPNHTALRSSDGSEHGQPGLSAVTPKRSPRTSGATTRPGNPPPRGISTQGSLLCTAYQIARDQGTKADADRVLRDLTKLAGGRENVSDFCAPIWHPTQQRNADDPGDPSYQDPHPPISIAPGFADRRLLN
jgi:hypothetical protein